MIGKALTTFCKSKLFALMIIFFPTLIHAQDSNAVSVFPIPVIFSTPETGFAFGASLFASATLNPGSAFDRQSSTQLAFVYTSKKQILAYVPFQVYLNKKGHLHEGEIGFYRYNYPFYGIGNGSEVSDLENYKVTYPRVIYNFYWLKNQHYFFGPGVRTDVFNALEYEEGGALEQNSVQGSAGGLFYALSVNFKVDKRDDVFFPMSGFINASVIEYAAPFGGSSYEGFGVRNDFSYYFPLFKQSVYAVNAGFEAYDANYPFYQKALIGGTKRLRGLINGRYRDNASLYVQQEARIAIAKRAYLVAFYGLGAVYSNGSEIWRNNLHHAVGVGARYRLFKANKLNMRLDVAYAEQDVQFYVTFGEAF